MFSVLSSVSRWRWLTPERQTIREIWYGAAHPCQVFCSVCKAKICFRPVPYLIGKHPLCGDCFAWIAGVTLQEAAERDGVRIVYSDPNKRYMEADDEDDMEAAWDDDFND